MIGQALRLINGVIRIQCIRCNLSAKYKDEKSAKFAGWWYDSRNGWLCKDCNKEYNAQLPLPFKAENLTHEDKIEWVKYLDKKEYDE